VILNLTLVADSVMVDRLVSLPGFVRPKLRATIQSLLFRLQALVQDGKLSGQVLNIRTGNLKASIHQSGPQETGTGVSGAVYSDGSVKYARIHEFGGVIRHPGGTAYIPITAEGRVAFISNAAAEEMRSPPPRTAAHDIPMPQRSFLRSSLRDLEATIVSEIRQTVVQAVAAGAI
jgi:phage gpG-like protein